MHQMIGRFAPVAVGLSAFGASLAAHAEDVAIVTTGAVSQLLVTGGAAVAAIGLASIGVAAIVASVRAARRAAT